MKRYNNGRGVWCATRPDTFPNGSSRRILNVGRCENVGFQRPHTDDGDLEDMHHDDSVNTKLNRLIDCFDKFDSWREEIDRRFENLDPMVMRGSDEFYYDDEMEESEYDDQRRRRTGERDYWRRNQNFGARGSNPHDERGRRDGRSCRGFCWDPPGGRQSRHQTGGFDNMQFNRSTSCWEPPPRRASRGYSTYDQPQPPTCWDYRVQQGYQVYDRQHPTSVPLKFNDRISEFVTIGDGESESIYYPDVYWESDEYEEDVDVSSMGGFLANELAYPRDIVKGKGQGKRSVPATKSRFRLGQPEHCTLPHFDDSRRPLRLNLSSAMKQDWERNPRRLSRPYLRRDPSSSSPPTVTVVPPPPAQYSSSCLSMTDHSRSASTLPAAAAVPSLNLPQPAAIVAKQPHREYQLPPMQPRSDRQPQQPSPPPPLELLPYSAPGPSQPLQPLPETAPLLASNRLPQAAVPSSRSKERQTNLQNVDEYGLINKVVPCSHDVVGEKNIVEDKWKENEMGPKGLVGSKDEEDSDIFRMIKVIILRAFDPGICVSFSKRKYGFLATQMEKSDLRESEKELPLEGIIKCLFAAAETFRIELHVLAKHVVFTNARKFNGDDEGKRSAARCVFDPGGDNSPKLLLSTLRGFVVSTLRTRWILTVGELIRSHIISLEITII